MIAVDAPPAVHRARPDEVSVRFPMASGQGEAGVRLFEASRRAAEHLGDSVVWAAPGVLPHMMRLERLLEERASARRVPKPSLDDRATDLLWEGDYVSPPRPRRTVRARIRVRTAIPPAPVHDELITEA